MGSLSWTATVTIATSRKVQDLGCFSLPFSSRPKKYALKPDEGRDSKPQRKLQTPSALRLIYKGNAVPRYSLQERPIQNQWHHAFPREVSTDPYHSAFSVAGILGVSRRQALQRETPPLISLPLKPKNAWWQFPAGCILQTAAAQGLWHL